MQIIRGGTLQSLMSRRQQKGQKFTDQQISKIMKSIFHSVNHIHSVSIIHRDIKPCKYSITTENILLPSEQIFDDLKMADFGLSTRLDFYYPKTATMKCGTMLYMAPQILCNYAYTKSVDIWSCSIIMFMLYKGKHPFYQSKMTTDQYKKKIKTVVFPQLDNKLAQDFLSRISKVQPNQRYSTQQALKHPWITRNSQDQIPLSIHQSFSGFEKSHKIAHLMKVLLVAKDYLKLDNKNEISKQYINKKDNYSIEHGLRMKMNKNSKSGKSIHSLSDIQMLFGKKQEPKQRIHKKSAEIQGQSPTILKLNQIFNSLFDKKGKKSKNYTEGFDLYPLPRQHLAEVPCIDEYKPRLEIAIEKAMIQYKGKLKNNRKRILPRKEQNKQEDIYGKVFKQDAKSSSLDSYSSSTSNNKIRYRKKIGTALKNNNYQ